MSLRARLKRLEQQASDPQWDDQPRDVFAEIEAHAAYLRGEGPRPLDLPCPRGFDPEQWASRQRIGRCVDYRLTGELGEGVYLPEMSDKEKALADGYLRAWPELQARLSEAP